MLRILQSAAIALGMISAAAVAQSDQEVEHLYFNTSDDLRLHYAKVGTSGSPVILIHGSGGAALTWLDNGIAQELAKNHIVICADMRGHGKSEGPRSGDMPLDVIELMDHLGFEKAHIHGFSMGGSIVARLMARVPERIITAAFGGSGVRETAEWRDKVPPDTDGEDPRYPAARQMYLDRRSNAREAFVEQEARRRAEMQGMEPTQRPGPPVRELDLTTIDFPVLAIVGELDGYYSRTHRLWREVKSFQGIKLSMTAHLTSYYPGFITDAYLMGLANFIDSHDEKPSER